MDNGIKKAFIAVAVGASVIFVPIAAKADTPPSGSAPYHGIDVYEGDSQIDWAQVAKSQQFAWIKVSEGENYVDSSYITNLSGAKANNILWGPYQFLRMYSPESCKRQADNFWSRIKDTGFTVIPAIDCETYDGNTTSDQIRACIRAFVDEFETLSGYKPIIYTYTNYANNNALSQYFSDCRLWQADYRGYTGDTGFPSWSAWQYTSKGTVSGIANHYVDLSIATKDIFINSLPSSTSTPQPTSNKDVYSVSRMPYEYNSIAKVDFNVRDSKGNIVAGRKVSTGDHICIIGIDYARQLAEVVYPTKTGYVHGYIKNLQPLLSNRYYNAWKNGKTTEPVYNTNNQKIGTIYANEKATLLYKTANGYMVLYGTSRGTETKSGIVKYAGGIK